MFNRARLKLTAWYLLIILLISVCFSFVIYQELSNEVDRLARASRLRAQRSFEINPFIPPPPVIDDDVLLEVKHHLILNLLAINGGIIVLSGALGYFLAGRTLRPIQQMLDDQNQFISDASHELRTPLTSLKTALEVNLRDKNLTLNDAKTLIEENIDDVNKLQSLSDSLLKLAQFQKPTQVLNLSDCDLKAIIAKAVKRIEPMAHAKSISLKTSLPPHLFLIADADNLVDLFVILLDNAVKYSPKGKVVLITSTQSDKSVTINVTDQGIGIEPDALPHIFDRFYRSDSARGRSGSGGYGLGLSIAQKIISRHHGSVFVKSQPGQGTTFSVTLPLRHNLHPVKPAIFS
ncbi:MAG TPA: HAMP domain-containing sensor histidine kinase [Patescibacteria group bacterium]